MSMELSAILWCVFNNYLSDLIIPLPQDGRVSFISANEMKKDYWLAIGYLKLNNFALRIDVFERIFFTARQKIKLGPFLDSADLMNPVGCNREQLKNILLFCGFKFIQLHNDRILFFYEAKKPLLKPKRINISKNSKNIKVVNTKKKIINNNKKSVDPNSPFAVLEKLL